MKTAGRSVIKSQDVKFVKTSNEITATVSHDQRKNSLPSSGMSEYCNTERKMEIVAERIQKAERESYEKGMAEGIQKGRELEKKETFQMLQSMSQAIKETSALKENILANVEKQIIKLSLDVAEKVLHSEVTTNRDVIKNVLKEAIRNIVDRENMKIRLNALDFHHMIEIKSDFLKNFDGIKNVVFEEDESVSRGGAIIETMFGEVDARLEQQLQEIEAVMTASDDSES